jgi:hypothetical protein
MKGRNNLGIAEFKNILTLYTSVSNLEEEIDRRRGKMSRSGLSSAILEAGLLLSDQEKIIVMMSVVVPSGEQVTNQSPPPAVAVEEVDNTTPPTTTKEVEVML